MNSKKLLSLTALGLLASSTAAQARYSEACFTKEEVQMMVEKRDVLSKASAECMKNYWNTHEQFYAKNHYSKYFGVRNHAIDSVDRRAKALLFILWPDFMSSDELNRFNQVYNMTASKEADGSQAYPGLSDIEKYVQKTNPRLYAQYLERKPTLNLIQRAQEEHGKERGGADLRGNTDPLEQNISCVDMSRRCLQEGFKQAGMIDTFEKIDKVTLAHDVSGTEMQKGLSDLGWRVLYFNPDPTQNAAWDAEDQQINPLPAPVPGKKPVVWQGSWGGHADGWSLNCDANGHLKPGKRTGGVLCSDEYQLGGEVPIPVDDKRLLVGFRTAIPAAFKAVPYFIGTAHGGYHVFPGYYGNIIEAHSVRALGSIDNLQVSSFNPLDQDHGGGPRWTNSEHYRTGVIVVPPGYLDKATENMNPPVDEDGCVDLKPRRH
ncbi:MAG: hypothetical protein ACXVB9_10595 [Bdellovibrionota bacterium]